MTKYLYQWIKNGLDSAIWDFYFIRALNQYRAS